jgi:tetratricopeptide (TPR) repeat protein|tara:strand:+ start:1636 stop:2958 length:1323 start_codon:yes stop_codon:yes gene_type:complete
MKRLTLAITLLILPLMFASLGHITTGVAYAAADGAKKEKKRTRKAPAMREKTYKTLSDAQVLIEEGTPAEAITILEKMMRKRKGLTRYEVALVWSTLAYAYYSVDDIPNTINAYEQVLAQGSDDITEAMELNSLRSIFQLYFSQENYVKALTYIDRWLALTELPDPATVYLKAICYYQMDDFRQSLNYARETEQLAIEQLKEVKEQWLYLQVVNLSEMEDYRNTVPVLEKLIVAYPKRQYWLQLAAMYAELEEEENALGAYYSAHMQGMLTRESEVVTLSQRLLNAEVPYEAAEVMAKGMDDGVVKSNEKNLRTLGMAWTMAQETEKAISTWRRASEYAEDGEIFYQLARALALEDQHADAVVAYRDALDKGDLKKPSEVSLLLGISEMQLGKWDKAVDAFKVASKDKQKAKQCRQYIKYVRGEKRREAELARMEKEFAL